jgi:hypothetical protein
MQGLYRIECVCVHTTSKLCTKFSTQPSPGNLNNYVDLVHTGTKFTYMSGTAVLCLAVPRYLMLLGGLVALWLGTA